MIFTMSLCIICSMELWFVRIINTYSIRSLDVIVSFIDEPSSLFPDVSEKRDTLLASFGTLLKLLGIVHGLEHYYLSYKCWCVNEFVLFPIF